MGKKKKEVIRLEHESVIPVLKHKLITSLSHHFQDKSDRDEFLMFCQRVEYTIRAWYLLQFEDLMQLYALFEPIRGAHKLEQQNLTPEDIDVFEQKFMACLFQVMDKSNFKIATDEEIDVALSAQYRLNLPIVVDESKLDKRLLTRYFAKHPHENLPYFADKFIVFRRGFGIDHMTAYFIKAKINTIISRAWRCFLRVTGLKGLFFKKSTTQSNLTAPVEITVDTEQDGLYVERIRIEKMKLRRAGSKKEMERNIYVKHFKNIPMADMEIVLSNLVAYQSLITQSVYNKQLDSGRGTLLHLCDEELDQHCEQLIKEEFNESCNFDVDDAVQKLKKLGLVTQEKTGIYKCVDLKDANDIIGTTTEEVVLKAKQGGIELERQDLGQDKLSSPQAVLDSLEECYDNLIF
ncbi:hypothetical protein HS088_TW23G00318 [Tripterygium wilfordii]|uniref:Uncharacterized protein n=1 Tax=Tripterygium wilfordii TaxID=458696 RepID=A0A7J7BUS2_TRIWF|nr:hypothetical protein HS088_TW23G00318 [Tripterygium wilfordii]